MLLLLPCDKLLDDDDDDGDDDAEMPLTTSFRKRRPYGPCVQTHFRPIDRGMGGGLNGIVLLHNDDSDKVEVAYWTIPKIPNSIIR